MSNRKMTKTTANKIAPWLYIIVGILLFVFRTEMLNWALIVIGAALLINGIVDIAGKRFIDGIIGAVAGIAAIFGGWLFIDAALIILGIGIAIKGVLDLAAEIKAQNGIGIAAAIITAIVGILLFIGKWATLDWMFIIIGIVFIINGLFLLKERKAD